MSETSGSIGTSGTESAVVPPNAEAPVSLVASARFFAETLAIPPGISDRDRDGLLESEVEELSVFPLENTAWGYVLNGTDTNGGTVLVYAASREQVNGRSDPELAHRHAVLPGFACLIGLRPKRTTWVVLLERDCVTLARIPAKALAPDLIRSRYGSELDARPESAWGVRQELLDSVAETAGDDLEDGIIRCASALVERNGRVRFPLEQQSAPGAEWRRYGTGRLGPELSLLAADVRDKRFLAEERARRGSIRRLRGVVRVAAVLFLLLCVFQYRYLARQHQLANLEQQLASQRPAVKALKEQETLAESAARLSQAPLEIFEWLSAVNEQRPDAMAFHTAYADRDGVLGFAGEAPSVLVVNQYREALQKSGRFRSVEVSEINSVKRGVTFTMRVQLLNAAGSQESS